MTKRIIVRAAAEADMAEAQEWYNAQRLGLGEQFVLCVEETFERLSHTPEMHQKVFKDARRAFVRRFPYLVYYRVRSDAVVILAVVHGRRDPQHWQSRV